MARLINLLGKEIRIFPWKSEERGLTLPPHQENGKIIQTCLYRSLHVDLFGDVPLFFAPEGKIFNLPEPIDDAYFIVSSEVGTAAARQLKRCDILVPGFPRFKNGVQIGFDGLSFPH